jgi:hypothetical protein
MPLPRHKVAAYHRARRARLKAEAAAASNVIPLACNPRNKSGERRPPMVRADAALPPDAIAQASPAEIAAVRADIAALGERGAVITQIGGRLRAVEPRLSPPPRSMVAIGGRPGRGLTVRDYAPPPPAKAVGVPSAGYALPTLAPGYEAKPANWFASVETMLAANASKTGALERRVAALEARAAEPPSFAQALFLAARAVMGER